MSAVPIEQLSFDDVRLVLTYDITAPPVVHQGQDGIHEFLNGWRWQHIGESCWAFGKRDFEEQPYFPVESVHQAAVQFFQDLDQRPDAKVRNAYVF